MLEQTQNIQDKEIELRKAIQSQWVLIVGTSLFIVATIGIFFFPVLRNLQTVLPIILVDLVCTWRTLAIRQAAQELREELTQMQQEVVAHTGIWPPPPRNPAV